MDHANQPVLANILVGTNPSKLRAVFLVFGGSLLLTASAKFQVPFYPVTMTLQTLVVLVLGVAYGSRLGMATVAFYLAQGIAGLPVFAGTPEKGIGLAYMVGPTGGYLLGFVFASGITGWLAERGFDRSTLKIAIAMIAGIAVIYFFGVLWLGSFVGYGEKVLALGVTPFLLGDLLKASLASVSLPIIWNILDKNPR